MTYKLKIYSGYEDLNIHIDDFQLLLKLFKISYKQYILLDDDKLSISDKDIVYSNNGHDGGFVCKYSKNKILVSFANANAYKAVQYLYIYSSFKKLKAITAKWQLLGAFS